MRHRKRRTRLGRQKSHREATLKAMARSVIINQKIKTTHVKAKEARRVVEKLITIAKQDTLAARRRAFAILGSKELVSKLFKEIVPLFKSRNGGYTRIIPFNFRKGDGASVVFLELTEQKIEEKAKPKKDKLQKKAAPEKEDKTEKPNAAPKVEEKVKEEKTVEHIKKEKARNEKRKVEKQKGFFRKMKGMFRRKAGM